MRESNIRSKAVASVLMVVLFQSEAFAESSPAHCRQLSPAVVQIADTVGSLAETLGSLSYDYQIQKLAIGSPERESMSRFRDDANEAIIALKKLRKSARDAAYELDKCAD